MNIDFLQFDSEVKILSILELFGSKIKALIERAAPRYLYDIRNMLKYNIIHPDEMDKLRKIILLYLAVGGNDKPLNSYSFESIDNLKFAQIRSSLPPVLKKSETVFFVSFCYFEKEITLTDLRKYLQSILHTIRSSVQF